MLAYTYISPGKFKLINKPKPELQCPRDAIVRITLGNICTSDLHIKHGSIPRAVPGLTVSHEWLAFFEAVGSEVSNVKVGGVDGCDCEEILSIIGAGKIDTTPLITHRYKLANIAEAYHLFENKLDGVIKVAVEP